MQRVNIPMGMKSDLDWSHIQVPKGPILWVFDFDLRESLDDEAQFLSLQIALDHFKVWSENYETAGALLFQGEIGILEKTIRTEKGRERLSLWLYDHGHAEQELEELLKQGRFLLKLHSRDLFLDFLILLMVALPPEVEPYLQLDVDEFSLAEQLEFYDTDLLKEFKFLDRDAPLGVLLPCKNYEKVALAIGNRPFRICRQNTLHMEWEGLEELVVDKEALSVAGGRACAGFEAAGGRIYLC